MCGFEIRHQLRQPLFPLVTGLLVILLWLAGAGELPGGLPGRLQVNAPAVLFEQLLKVFPLALLLLAAAVASAALRDFELRTDALFFACPIARRDFVTARFAGVLVVCALACIAGALAFACGTLFAAAEPARVGPFRVASYAFGLGVLLLPTIAAIGAAAFALATWTRSRVATYLGVVAGAALSAAATEISSRFGASWIGQLLDPFGVAALAGAVRYWTAAELDAAIPELRGLLLWNRLLWLAFGAAALAWAASRFDPARGRSQRTHPAPRRQEERASAAPLAAAPARPPRRPRAWREAFKLVSLARFETATVLGSPPFLGAVGIGLVVLLQAAGAAGDLFGMPVHPRTHLMLSALRGGYSIVLLLVVVIYSGELVWRERAPELRETYDALPTSSGMFLAAKLVALLATIAVYLSAGVMALIAFQLAHGYQLLELGLYARGAAMIAVYPALMLVLSVAAHLVSPHRLLGYGMVMAFVLAWDLLEELGFEHHLYRYASLPATPYSDFNGFGPFLEPFGWFSSYWACGALLLAGIALLFWKRGTENGWGPRLAAARTRLRGPAGGLLGTGALGFAACGAFIFLNTNVRNTYLPGAELAAKRASYERSYARYDGLELPRIVSVRVDVDIFPEQRRAEVRGIYRLGNTTSRPLADLHLSVPEQMRLERLSLPAHQVVLDDAALGYRILRLAKPLAPGDTIELGFGLELAARGFLNHGTSVALVENGSYFTKREVLPVIGYDAQRQLVDPDARLRQGLAPAAPWASREDLPARRRTPRAPDADRVDFESTISTSLDQIALTSGELQREWVSGGRRHFHYRAERPIAHHMAWMSARYAVARSEQHGVTIEVYHHPGHAENVGRMMAAARRTLAYGSASFGPYPFRHLRIVEYPGYVRDATSFPGVIALSETLGFNARLGADAAIDFPFYVTAHEVAHQWWGQQVVGAAAQGVGTLHETLAQYTALMAIEHEMGLEPVYRVLDHERHWYRRGRAEALGEEPPLALVEREEYVYYHKGALAMYALREAVGERPLNRALASFFARASRTQPPYLTTLELQEELSVLVPAGSPHLLEELFLNRGLPSAPAPQLRNP